MSLISSGVDLLEVLEKIETSANIRFNCCCCHGKGCSRSRALLKVMTIDQGTSDRNDQGVGHIHHRAGHLYGCGCHHGHAVCSHP